jgi:hypothetical protein
MGLKMDRDKFSTIKELSRVHIGHEQASKSSNHKYDDFCIPTTCTALDIPKVHKLIPLCSSLSAKYSRSLILTTVQMENECLVILFACVILFVAYSSKLHAFINVCLVKLCVRCIILYYIDWVRWVGVVFTFLHVHVSVYMYVNNLCVQSLFVNPVRLRNQPFKTSPQEWSHVIGPSWHCNFNKEGVFTILIDHIRPRTPICMMLEKWERASVCPLIIIIIITFCINMSVMFVIILFLLMFDFSYYCWYYTLKRL